MMQLAAVCLLLLLLPAASSGGAGTPLHSAFAPPALGALLWTRAALRGRATSPAVPRFGVRAERMGGLRMVLERQPGWGGYVDRSNQVKASGGAVREGRKAVETALGGGADSTSPEGESITRKEAVLPPLGLVPALARRHPAAEDEIVRQIEREERPVLDLRVFLDCEERASLEIEKGAVLEFEDSEKGAASDFEEGSVSESVSDGEGGVVRGRGRPRLSPEQKIINRAQTQANYQTSKKGRDATAAYANSTEGRASQARRNAKYKKSEKGQAATAAYAKSEEGRAAKATYEASEGRRAGKAAYQAAYALLPEVIAAKEARRVASMEETARRYLEVDANVALLSRPEAQHLGEQLFTEQEFEVLNNATMKRAFEDKTHCVNVLITKLEKEKEDRAWFTKRGGGRPALLWKRTPKAYISPTHAFERLGFQSETVMWLTTRRSARLLEESLQALCLEAAPFGIVTNRKAGVGAYLDKRDDDGDGNFAFVQVVISAAPILSMTFETHQSEPGGAEEQRLRQLQLGDGGGRGENGWVYVNH